MGSEPLIRLGDSIELKDGENHKQEGWARRFVDIHGELIGVSLLDAPDVGAKVVIPGYINEMDLATASRVIAYINQKYNSRGGTHVFCSSKHGGAVVLGIGDTQLLAVKRALAGDINSPFGGFFASNMPIERGTAEFLNGAFFAGMLAPGYEDGVVGLLGDTEFHKKRILIEHPVVTLAELDGDYRFRQVPGGIIAQTPQNLDFDIREEACVVSGNQANGGSMRVSSLDDELIVAAQLGVDMLGLLTSNTVVYTTQNAVIGIGNGVGNRYQAARNGRANMEESLWNHVSNVRYWKRVLHGKPFSFDDFGEVLDPNFKIVVSSDGFYPDPDGFIESIGVDRVSAHFANGMFEYVVENAKGERKDRLMYLARANYGHHHGTYDRNLVAKVVVQPGLCDGDPASRAISDRFGVPMIFLVSEGKYSERRELLKSGRKNEARGIEGARRFSH